MILFFVSLCERAQPPAEELEFLFTLSLVIRSVVPSLNPAVANWVKSFADGSIGIEFRDLFISLFRVIDPPIEHSTIEEQGEGYWSQIPATQF